jgi:hypothetical protein
MYLNGLNTQQANKENTITIPNEDNPAIGDNENLKIAIQTALCLANGGKIYWSSLEGSPTQPVCQDSSVLAVADFTDKNGAGEMKYAPSLNKAPLALNGSSDITSNIKNLIST